jgi:hypothetical protein
MSFHTLTISDGDWAFGTSLGFFNLFTDVSNAETTVAAQDNVNLRVEGNVFLNAGDQTLDFASSEGVWEIGGGIFFSGSQTLTVQTGTLHILNGADFNFAAGTIDDSSATGTFINDGSISVGASPGAGVIDGDTSWGDTASFEVELGGLTPGIHDGYDVLTVTGEFDAAGTINVVEFGDFDVTAGDVFDVVQAGTMTGEFSDFTGLDVGHGVVLDVTQTAAGVTLIGAAVTQQGTAGDDTLTGSSGTDVFSGGSGGDFILGGGGTDLMHGGAGDDVFVTPDTGFGRIDGGDGFDTVRFDSPGQSFDLTGLRGDQVNAIEKIDLTGNGNNVLTLNTSTVRAATRGANAETGTDHTLIVDGDSGDTVDAGAGWTNTGTETVDGQSYSVYESDDSDANLYVNAAVAVNAA